MGDGDILSPGLADYLGPAFTPLVVILFDVLVQPIYFLYVIAVAGLHSCSSRLLLMTRPAHVPPPDVSLATALASGLIGVVVLLGLVTATIVFVAWLHR